MEKNFSSTSAIHLDLGNLAHKALEIKGRLIIDKKPIDYNELNRVTYEGIEEVTDKGSEKILGVNDIKRKYFEDWYIPDNKSCMNYEQKIQLFLNKVLIKEMSDPSWTPVATELNFEFVYDNRVIIHGFIDRVDKQNEGSEIRVVDYKSSKSVFDDTKVKTPLQMVIYALACFFLYGRIPIEYQYDFIFIDQIQEACSKGYLNRGLKKLDKLLNQIEDLAKSGDYRPSCTPLCYWCDFASHTPNAEPKFNHLCKFHSLWTPTDKTFAVRNPFNSNDNSNNNSNNNDKPQRKLVF